MQYLDRLLPIFRRHSGLNYDADPNSAYQQQFKRAFIKGLQAPVRVHVEKHWVTQDTGSLDDQVQQAEHAQTVVKKKQTANTRVFTLNIDPAGLVAYWGNWKGGKQRV